VKLLLVKFWHHVPSHLPSLVYGVVALCIMLPLLAPGYIFALDMVFGPDIQLPPASQSSYPFYVLLNGLGYILNTQIIEKILLFSILLLSGIGAHRLTMYVAAIPTLKGNRLAADDTKPYYAYFSGLLYMVNPFTYDRFMDGQFAVLLGYALLPFFVKLLFGFLFTSPSWRTGLRLTALAIVIGICSIHTIGMLGVLTLVGSLIFIWKNRQDSIRIGRFLVLSLGLITIFMAANSFWLIPLVQGSSSTAGLIQDVDSRHLLAFRTNGSSDWAVVGNMLGLQGYWGEREGRFTTVATAAPWWPLMAAVILLLVFIGGRSYWKYAQVKLIVVTCLIAAILAVGIAADPFKHLNQWLVTNLTFFKGYREPQKLVALLALTYAVLGGLGVLRLSAKAKTVHRQTAHLLLILPFVLTPTMLFGFAGQFKPADYPHDWYTTNQEIVSKAKGGTLFLPWHQYMYYDFANQVIINPAPKFFDGQVIAGDNAEIGLVERQSASHRGKVIEALLKDKNVTNLGAKLAKPNIEFVVLSKTADWKTYSILRRQKDLKLISETESLEVYRNLAYERGTL
jgi:hypothetical protein